MIDSSDLRPLFIDYARGAVSAAQRRALEAMLREDSDRRRDFIEYMNIDSALGDMAALSEDELAECEEIKFGDESRLTESGAFAAIGRTNDRPTPTYRIIAIRGALAATLLFAPFLWLTKPSESEQAPVAILVTDVDAVLLCDGRPCKDTELQAGKYRLDGGLLQLRFDDGVMVYVEAPAHFDAVSDKRVLLHSGRLSARVPFEGIGFTVETPEAEVVDFGTEFAVEVEGGASEVHVFDGLVRVHPGASNRRDVSRSVDLRASQALRITFGAAVPEDISIATDRFIRDFNEPRFNYIRAVKRLSPLAHYRMPIRDRGLVSEPPEYSGVVLTGDGKRPPHAQGVFVGGSLRVGADSTGRGGRVDSPPVFNTGQFTLTAFVFLEESAKSGMVATNSNGESGNFAVSLDENGMLQAAIRCSDGEVNVAAGSSILPLKTWRHVGVTADGEQLQFYEDGRLVAIAPCTALATSDSDTLWFGTDASATQVWDGRIDEVALFDRALTAEEIEALYRTAQEEIARTQ